MSVKTLKIKIISWQFLRFLLSYTALFISRENHRNNSFLHRFIMGKPNIHSIWISLNSSWTIFHDSYHLYNWCKIPIVFDYFFQLFVCVVSLKPEEIETGGRSQISKQKKMMFFLKFYLMNVAFSQKVSTLWLSTY